MAANRGRARIKHDRVQGGIAGPGGPSLQQQAVDVMSRRGWLGVALAEVSQLALGRVGLEQGESK